MRGDTMDTAKVIKELRESVKMNRKDNEIVLFETKDK